MRLPTAMANLLTLFCRWSPRSLIEGFVFVGVEGESCLLGAAGGRLLLLFGVSLGNDDVTGNAKSKGASCS